MPVPELEKEAPPTGRLGGRALRRVGRGLQGVAGLLGAAGVALAAAAAHKGGGALTTSAATIAVLHAVAILAITGLALILPESASVWLVGAGLMAFGTVLFSGDLALAGLADARPWPSAAPIGGTMLIVAWLVVSMTAFTRTSRSR